MNAHIVKTSMKYTGFINKSVKLSTNLGISLAITCMVR